MSDHHLDHIHDEELEAQRRSTVYMLAGLAVVIVVLAALVIAARSIAISIH